MSDRESQPPRQRAVDPMFDGHLQQPFEEMTDAERLQWAWEGAQLLHWARRAKTIEQPSESRTTKDEKRRAD